MTDEKNKQKYLFFYIYYDNKEYLYLFDYYIFVMKLKIYIEYLIN